MILSNTPVLWKYFVPLTIVLCMAGCGNSSSDKEKNASTDSVSSTSSSSTSKTTPVVSGDDTGAAVFGMGVKGPLMNASVTMHRIAPDQANGLGEVIATGYTDASATLHLHVPLSSLTDNAYLIEYSNGRELSGSVPEIRVLRTVVSRNQIEQGIPTYATPMTTWVIDYALQSADSSAQNTDARRGLTGDSNGSISPAEFESALTTAQAYAKSALGMGVLDDSVDVFTTAPVLSDDVSQSSSLAYRMANEALAAIVVDIRAALPGDVSADTVLHALVKDMSDGTIDGVSDTGTVDTLTGISQGELNSIVTADPMQMTVPGGSETISNMATMMAQESQTLAPQLTPEPLPTPTLSAVNIVSITGQQTAASDQTTSSSPDASSTTSTTTTNTSTKTSVASTSYSVVLQWSLPSQREDGSSLPVSDIAGYELYYYKESSSASEGEVKNIPAMQNGNYVSNYSISVAQPGSYIFAIATYDTNGLYSEISTPITVNIP